MSDDVDGINRRDMAARSALAPPTTEQKQVIRAAKNGDTDAVRVLIASDAALLDARDADGSTPLHCAAWKGHIEVVSLLLDRGADVNARSQNDHWGDSPLHAAAHGNRRAVAEVLIARGANIRAVNSRGLTPLAETRIHDAKAVANCLRKHGVTE